MTSTSTPRRPEWLLAVAGALLFLVLDLVLTLLAAAVVVGAVGEVAQASAAARLAAGVVGVVATGLAALVVAAVVARLGDASTGWRRRVVCCALGPVVVTAGVALGTVLRGSVVQVASALAALPVVVGACLLGVRLGRPARSEVVYTAEWP